MIPVSLSGGVEPGARTGTSVNGLPVREDKYIFVRHVEESEGIVIMGPSEHN